MNHGMRVEPDSPTIRFYLTGLHLELAATLVHALQRQGCRQVQQPRFADILFCPPAPSEVDSILQRAAGRPVIAVGATGETAQWLDALEAGAADYCVTPFEDVHMRWLIERHTRGNQAASAVA